MTTTTISPDHHRSLGDHTWQDEAVCQSTEYNPVDPEIFFPEPDETAKITAAKSLCGQCPVRRACLDAALENNDTDGIRGGLTEEERRLRCTRSSPTASTTAVSTPPSPGATSTSQRPNAARSSRPPTATASPNSAWPGS